MTGKISKGINLGVSSVNGTIPAGSTHAEGVSASVPTGRTFLCWIGFATTGWVGSLYASNYRTASNVWVWAVGSTSTSDRNFTGYYLYY